MIGLCAGLLFLLSCTYSNTVQDFHSIPAEGWYKRTTESFFIPVRDSSVHYAVTVNIRHNTLFRYQDLWLYVFYPTPSDSLLCDTVKLQVSDESGHWLGQGWGSLFQLSVPLKNPLVVLKGDSAALQVRPAMQDDYVKGVTEVGFTLKAQ